MHLRLAFKIVAGLLPLLADARAIVGQLTNREAEDFTSLVERGASPEFSNKTLVARATGNSPQDPIPIHIDCTNLPDICEVDCYCILCYHAPDVLQRVVDQTLTDRRRSQSGDAANPFRADRASMAARGIHGLMHPQWVSPEEYPFASSKQGGVGACLAPVAQQQQQAQAGALSSEFTTHVDGGERVPDRKWYKVNFNGQGRYCTALRARDPTVCQNQPSYDWSNFIYVRTTEYRKPVKFGLSAGRLYDNIRNSLIDSWPKVD